jgi:hypothetical protein
MKQIGRLDRYQKELASITHAKDIPSDWLRRINVAEPPSKLSASTARARSSLFANREENHEYRSNAPGTSVVHNDQLWNFINVVPVLHAWARLDVSASRQMVSSFS